MICLSFLGYFFLSDTFKVQISAMWNVDISSLLPSWFLLQAISKRIHYGKFVAEAKFRESPDIFEDAIRYQVHTSILRRFFSSLKEVFATSFAI